MAFFTIGPVSTVSELRNGNSIRLLIQCMTLTFLDLLSFFLFKRRDEDLIKDTKLLSLSHHDFWHLNYRLF